MHENMCEIFGCLVMVGVEKKFEKTAMPDMATFYQFFCVGEKESQTPKGFDGDLEVPNI